METAGSGPSLHFPSLLDPHSPKHSGFKMLKLRDPTRVDPGSWRGHSPQEPMGFSLWAPRGYKLHCGLLNRGLAEDVSMDMGVDIREKADLRDRFSGAHGGPFSPIEKVS